MEVTAKSDVHVRSTHRCVRTTLQRVATRWRHKRQRQGGREADDDSGETHWWVNLIEEDKSSFKEQIPKPKIELEVRGNVVVQKRRHNSSKVVEAVILGRE